MNNVMLFTLSKGSGHLSALSWSSLQVQLIHAQIITVPLLPESVCAIIFQYYIVWEETQQACAAYNAASTVPTNLPFVFQLYLWVFAGVFLFDAPRGHGHTGDKIVETAQ